MEFWNNQILPRLSNVEMIEWFTFAVNALVFLFSKKIASSYGQVKEEAKVRARLRLLHGFNLTVFVTFILSVAIKTDRLLPDEQSLAAVDAKVEATKEVFITAETAAQTAKNNSADDPKSKAEAETKRKEADTARDAYDKLIKNKPVPGKFRFPAAKISQTCLTLLVAYLMIYLAEALLLYRYGREVTVMGYPRRVETSTSRTLELLAYGIIVVCSVVVLVNIWDLTSSLQTTGVIGFLALLIFTTKDYWMRDFLSGILLISSERLGRGDVISIPTENVLGIVLEIRSRQTHVRDLVHGHDIMLPNACLLKNRVDLYKQNPGGPFRDFVDFKISYGAPSEKVQQFLIAVFEKAAESMDSLDREKSARIALKENGNHAARWRLAYILKNPHRLLDVRDAVNLAAYELQDQFELNVSTPTTHVVETRSGNPAKTSSKAEITGSESSS